MVQHIFTHRSPQLINMHKVRKDYWSRACGTGSDAPDKRKREKQSNITCSTVVMINVV